MAVSRRLMAAGLALAFSTCAGASALRTAAQEESLPKFQQQGERWIGYCVDLFRALERVTPGLTIVGDQQPLPLKRIILEVASGQLDLACGLLDTAERRAMLRYAQPALYEVRYYLAVRKDDRVSVRQWKDVLALGQDNIILVNYGSGAVDRLKQIPGLQLDTLAGSTENNLLKLLAKRGRFFYYREPGLSQALKATKLDKRIRVLPNTMDITTFHLVLNPNLPPEQIRQLEEGLTRLKQDGTLNKLDLQWNQLTQTRH